MKVLFICNSLEEGKDGIGDYTKKLSLESQSYNISPVIVAFNDKYIYELQSGFFEDVPFYRIPEQWPISKKEAKVKEILANNAPVDWVSLQFVNYGLDGRGIVKKFILPFCRMFKGYKVHVMMHELWVGEESEATFKMKLLGRVQKFFIRSLLRNIKPDIIHTSIPLYKKILNQYDIKAGVLPIFSNISLHTDISIDFKEKIPEKLINNRDNYIVGCLFGSIYYDSWDMSRLFKMLEEKGRKENKKILITSIGKIGYGKEFWETLPLKYPILEFLTIGQQDETFISNCLHSIVDFGIITTPALIAGKSGSYMAFLEHGIPVFCKTNELSFNFDISEDLIDQRLTQINGATELEIPHHMPSVSQIKTTVQEFVKTLNNFK